MNTSTVPAAYQERGVAFAQTPAGDTAPASARPAEQAGASRRNEPAIVPAVDVIEDATGITLYADLPGVSKESLALDVERDTLTIEGTVQLVQPEGLAVRHVEVERARYRRVFTLSKELDSQQVTAELSQGVLKLRIPKAQHAQPRRIPVNVA
ncbi:Hsp20/alpha crystallin family protein [Aquincola sp. MAHUQ-54]|uniref:Hsp20/alpha crystallin family protein n=1 Tax=Aquincola agrisoli TaxID=3119538 RepID=A0AAW9QA00_9BURK